MVDADYEKEAAKLQKGADAFWINMAGQVSPGSDGSEPVFAPSPAAGPSPAGMPFATVAPPSPGGRISYAERVKLRRAAMEERRKQQEEAMKKEPVVSPEEKEKQLKEYQMDLIRAGGEKGPALPLPLTKEMDDQLVAEGVLPPQDGSGAAAEAAPAPTEGEAPPAQ